MTLISSDSWYLVTSDQKKIGAIMTVAEGTIHKARRVVFYPKELFMTAKNFDVDKIPQFDIVHEYREKDKWKKTTYKKAWFHALPKPCNIGGDIVVMEEAEFGYEKEVKE